MQPVNRSFRRSPLVAVLVLMSCGGSNYELTTARRSYAMGEVITLELRNNTLREWGYNLCTSQFEPPLPGYGLTCALPLHTLHALEVVTFNVPLPEDTTSGEYVLKTSVSSLVDGPGGGWAKTEPITITQ